MDLTEAEDIKKRWQEYMEELYKKDFHDSDNHDGVITHLEPDILGTGLPGLGTEHLPGALCSGTGSPALGLCSP